MSNSHNSHHLQNIQPHPNPTASPVEFSPLLSALLKNQPNSNIFGTPSSSFNLLSPFSSDFLHSHQLSSSSPVSIAPMSPFPSPFPTIAPKVSEPNDSIRIAPKPTDFSRPVPIMLLPPKFHDKLIKKETYKPIEPAPATEWKIIHSDPTYVSSNVTTSVVLKTRKEKVGELILDK
jgi:hypothetical protein